MERPICLHARVWLNRPRRYAIAVNAEMVEHPKGQWVRYRDHYGLRVANSGVTNKLRQVLARYQESLERLAQLERALLELQQRSSKLEGKTKAELAALRKLAQVVALRAGNHPEIQEALRLCGNRTPNTVIE